MATLIQRVPRALLNLIGNYGGETPRELADQLVANLDALQLYGLSQLTSLSASNAALAPGGGLTIPVPLNQTWVFFGGVARFDEAVALTFMDISIGMQGSNQWNTRIQGPGIVGRQATLAIRAPYPSILLGGDAVTATFNFAGVANVNAAMTAVVGILG